VLRWIVEQQCKGLLTEIQNSLFNKALDFRNNHITEVDTFDDFKTALETKTGFISAHWDGTNETEDKIKALTKATIRCIPLEGKVEEGVCVFTGNPSKRRVLFAKAY
jgi:prolyl-tRNA synthetase